MDSKKIAELARLRLTDEEAKKYGEQLGSILAYIEKLGELKTDGVAELAHAVGDDNVFRADESAPCASDVRRGILEGFPRRQGDLLEVQAVFEDRTL